jgi:Tol biopolymer transport system component
MGAQSGTADCGSMESQQPQQTLAFAAKRDGASEIYVFTVGDAAGRQITKNGVTDTNPAWSPDGDAIAYLSETSPDEFGLRITDPSVGSETTIVGPPKRIALILPGESGDFVEDLPGDDINAGITWFAWSNDSARFSVILASDSGNRSDLYSLDRAGTEAFRLTPDNVIVGNTHAWAPDDSTIAFDGSQSSNAFFQRVMLVGLQGEDLRTVRPSDLRDMTPQWHPSALKLLYVGQAAPSTSAHLFEYDPATQTTTQLTTGERNVTIGKWSPDGERIAYGWVEHGIYGTVVSTGISILAGDGAERLIQGHGIDTRFFSWTPDGTGIAYIQEDSGIDNLYLYDACADSTRILVKDIVPSTPSWRPVR